MLARLYLIAAVCYGAYMVLAPDAAMCEYLWNVVMLPIRAGECMAHTIVAMARLAVDTFDVNYALWMRFYYLKLLPYFDYYVIANVVYVNDRLLRVFDYQPNWYRPENNFTF